MRRHRLTQHPACVRLAREYGLELRDFWRTPPAVLDELRREFGELVLDAAACAEDAVCERFLSPAEDALRCEWGPFPQARMKWVWCNPPYSRKGGGLLVWLRRCIEQAIRWDIVVVMLAPPGVGSRYRNEAVYWLVDVRDLPRRMAFIHPVSGQPVRGNREGSTLFVICPWISRCRNG